MRILVTGGAGFIGARLVRRLVRENAGSVTALDNLHRGALETLAGCSHQIRFLEMDIRDPHTLQEALKGIELVYHLAAQSSVLSAAVDLEYAFSSNVAGTFNLLRAARANKVRRIVFTSSREVYGEAQQVPVPETAAIRPKNAYGASKAAGEMYCQAFASEGVEVVVLRLANVYGPGDSDRVLPIFIDNALRGVPLTLYGGQQVLDFIWIDTVVEALLKAGLAPRMSTPINVGSGKGTSLAELSRRVLAATKSRSPVRIAPGREIEVTRFVADITRAAEVFDLKQPDDPLFGLEDVVEWSRSRLLANYDR